MLTTILLCVSVALCVLGFGLSRVAAQRHRAGWILGLGGFSLLAAILLH